ncbi:MAG: metallophosphoesterase [Spirochaetales bacterium]|nr:metallophosphoesterase [Spirochaetales bacterium]
MKILCIADHIDPTIYSDNIRTRFKDIDIILSAGDLRFNYYDYIMSNLNKPLYFVFGNHNLNGLKYYKKDFKEEVYDLVNKRVRFGKGGGTYIDRKIIKCKNLLIGGLGGSMWYNGGKNQFTEFGMFLKIVKMLPALIFNRIVHGRFIDILLTHSPPFGIHDQKDRCHRGFKVFLYFLRLFKPRFMLHGHIHLYSPCDKRLDRFHSTDVINVYNHYIVEI